MKKLKVIVRDRNTLILDSDGVKGDYIDLSELNELDYSELEGVVNKYYFDIELFFGKDEQKHGCTSR